MGSKHTACFPVPDRDDPPIRRAKKPVSCAALVVVVGMLLCLLLVALLAGAPAAPVPAAAQAPAGRPGRRAAAPSTCGGAGQSCCAACEELGAPDSVCDQYLCNGNNQCYTFADANGIPPDGTARFPLLCVPANPSCGKEGQACCYNPDPSSTSRCLQGMSCVVQGQTSYSSQYQYKQLQKDLKLANSTALMGVCRKLNKSSCGKLWLPCGSSAKKLGCSGGALSCPAGSYCASPGDTRLGEPRCLPLPPGCGKLDGPCCPANANNTIRERARYDNKTAVPFCNDGKSFCVWQYSDYAQHGTANFPAQNPNEPPVPFPWDGVFERGYGRSRCAPLPGNDCGAPGKRCCPSIDDRFTSGMSTNRDFKYQPCNYRAVGRSGIYCKGAWQGELLKKGVQLGVCTPNPTDCGKAPGKVCCLSDVPQGVIGQCMTSSPPGTYYCTEGNYTCTKCPSKLSTPFLQQECGGFQP